MGRIWEGWSLFGIEQELLELRWTIGERLLIVQHGFELVEVPPVGLLPVVATNPVGDGIRHRGGEHMLRKKPARGEWLLSSSAPVASTLEQERMPKN